MAKAQNDVLTTPKTEEITMQVVSIKQLLREVYAGGNTNVSVRSLLNNRYPQQWMYVGRRCWSTRFVHAASPLANPIRRLDREPRGSTLSQYKQWLWQQMQLPHSTVMQALHELSADTVLVCWCD
ncbi:MAG: DUF4326 domain-containing protein, partial [Methylococcales bacterium]|nr:DUF4326 domain-containing protein [Methylococcales bacterium]